MCKWEKEPTLSLSNDRWQSFCKQHQNKTKRKTQHPSSKWRMSTSVYSIYSLVECWISQMYSEQTLRRAFQLCTNGISESMCLRLYLWSLVFCSSFHAHVPIDLVKVCCCRQCWCWFFMCFGNNIGNKLNLYIPFGA